MIGANDKHGREPAVQIRNTVYLPPVSRRVLANTAHALLRRVKGLRQRKGERPSEFACRAADTQEAADIWLNLYGRVNVGATPRFVVTAGRTIERDGVPWLIVQRIPSDGGNGCSPVFADDATHTLCGVLNAIDQAMGSQK